MDPDDGSVSSTDRAKPWYGLGYGADYVLDTNAVAQAVGYDKQKGVQQVRQLVVDAASLAAAKIAAAALISGGSLAGNIALGAQAANTAVQAINSSQDDAIEACDEQNESVWVGAGVRFATPLVASTNSSCGDLVVLKY